jgi:hypothetical protein
MPEGTRELLERACVEAGVALQTDVDRLSGSPAFVLGALPVGQRSIPKHLASAAEKNDARLLLLCDEALVDGARSLSQGALTLLGTPYSAADLGRWLRSLSRGESCEREQEEVRIVEQRSRRLWRAGLRRSSGEEAIEAEESEQHLTLWHRTDGARSEILRVDLRHEQVCLAPLEESAAVWLLSARRLPPAFELKPEAGSELVLSFAESDLLIVAVGKSPNWTAEELVQAAKGGPQELVDQLARDLEAGGQDLQAVEIVEVLA